MRIMLSGEERHVEPGMTLRALIEHVGLANAACAAEVNESLVPRARHVETTLEEGDRIELVTLVGGG